MTNGVSVQMKLAKHLPLVQGDQVQLQQVMLNLIINAVEAMSPHAAGSRDVLIRTAKTRSGGVLVAVCDSGPGVDPVESGAHLRRILQYEGGWFGDGPIDLPCDHPGAWGTTDGAAPE